MAGGRGCNQPGLLSEAMQPGCWGRSCPFPQSRWQITHAVSSASTRERARCWTEKKSLLFLMSQTLSFKRSHSNIPGVGGSTCSLIWAINGNFICQENVQKMICYSKGLCPFLCSDYISSRQVGRVRAAAGGINLCHCTNLSSCPWRKDHWDFLERGQGSGLGTGRAI